MPALQSPDVTQLDLTGPIQVLSRLPGAQIALPRQEIEPISTDSGFSIMPTTTFADAPQADILVVPGGRGAFAVLDDAVVVEFMRHQAADGGTKRSRNQALGGTPRCRRTSPATLGGEPARCRSGQATRHRAAARAQPAVASLMLTCHTIPKRSVKLP